LALPDSGRTVGEEFRICRNLFDGFFERNPEAVIDFAAEAAAIGGGVRYGFEFILEASSLKNKLEMRQTSLAISA